MRLILSLIVSSFMLNRSARAKTLTLELKRAERESKKDSRSDIRRLFFFR